MCRLLAIQSAQAFDPGPHLRAFSAIAQNSKEFQGHGWGCARLDADGAWCVYHNVRPIWEDDVGRFEPTTLLMAHARSAFLDEGIAVENNMPFGDGRNIFIFNGELRGVTIRQDGRIGAEKIFNFIRRFDQGDMHRAMAKALPIIRSRTRHIRAMNLIISDGARLYLSSEFNDDPDYFTMHCKRSGDEWTVCSERYGDAAGWQAIANGQLQVLE